MTEEQFYPVSEPDLSEVELHNATDAITSTWIGGSGPYLNEFEERFADLCGTQHALATANGTVALHLILAGLGVGPGDEVIIPSFTYVATANAVTYTGATPVFADIDPGNLCLDPKHVASLVSPRTVAIIAVHLYGHPADMDALQVIATRHGLALIEDAAEAPFATYKGRPTGQLGQAASFSFFGNKLLTCGEGGAVTTSDGALATRMRQLRGQGMDPNRRYYFPIVGYNYRLTNVSAAILCAQLTRQDELIGRRATVMRAYSTHLASREDISLPPQQAWANPSPWLQGALMTSSSRYTRDEVMVRLAERGVETRPFFIPIHTLPPYKHLPTPDLPVTRDAAGRGFNLPTASTMTAHDARVIAHRLIDVLDS